MMEGVCRGGRGIQRHQRSSGEVWGWKLSAPSKRSCHISWSGLPTSVKIVPRLHLSSYWPPITCPPHCSSVLGLKCPSGSSLLSLSLALLTFACFHSPYRHPRANIPPTSTSTSTFHHLRAALLIPRRATARFPQSTVGSALRVASTTSNPTRRPPPPRAPPFPCIRGPWPFINMSSDSDDDKPLVKGTYALNLGFGP